MNLPGDSRTTYQQDLLGHIEYRSAKPIKAYEKWYITSVIKPIETTIRASPDLAEFRQSVQDGVDEKYLYSPLQGIFRMIEGAAAEVTGYKRTQFRQLVSMADHVPDAENMSFPHNKPNFVLAEVPPTSGSLTPAIDVGSDGVKWRHISGFIEVKPYVWEGPNATESTSVGQIVLQGANYARLIMAARPFQLYVLCVFIYGHKFSLGWYDRRGVIISDDYDILDNLDVLVNVILQLTTLWHKKPDNESQIQQLYRTLFGGHTIRLIRQGRSCFLDESDPPVYLFDALDPPTHKLLYGCWRLLKIQRSSNFPINECRAKIDRGMQWTSGSEELKVITYAQLYKIYDIAMPTFRS